ncbi:MAG: ABC transporter ATP-binding protein [Clostridia bacterium]|nr:ABC transporter ATP-binding protein [Clostridia bacterium]
MIEVNNITKKFGSFTALDNVTCTIPEGCIYGMVGSNGAGKSTLLRLISGVYRPDAGEVLIDGEPVWENETVKAQIGFVPDELYFLSGASMTRMAELYKAAFPRFDQKRFRELADAFGLDTKKSIGTFSKGMKRQASTALALACCPKYLFFDETFDGLDPIMRTLVKKLICNDVIERKATAIITSHSLRELEDTCDQLALLHKGGLVLQSDVQNLKTSLFKVQIAFNRDFDRDTFRELNLLHYTRHGSVASIIVRGDREQTVAILQSKMPVLLDVLPLTLEEVFTYEMEALGYIFDDGMKEGTK